jgi:hypothetical protein
MKRLELDELGEGEDWALAEDAATMAATQRKLTYRISNIQREDDMPKPP